MSIALSPSPNQKPTTISVLDISKQIIDHCNWNDECYQQCLDDLSETVVILSAWKRRDVLTYFNDSAPDKFKIDNMDEFKKLLKIE